MCILLGYIGQYLMAFFVIYTIGMNISFIRTILIYNDFTKPFEIDLKKKVGEIQKEILQMVSLMIYNIEKMEIYFEEGGGPLIVGKDEGLEFDAILENYKNPIYHIEKFVIYDRLRDENGNVIKNNEIIDAYVAWQQKELENEYLNYNYSESNLSNYFQTNRVYISGTYLPRFYTHRFYINSETVTPLHRQNNGDDAMGTSQEDDDIVTSQEDDDIVTSQEDDDIVTSQDDDADDAPQEEAIDDSDEAPQEDATGTSQEDATGTSQEGDAQEDESHGGAFHEGTYRGGPFQSGPFRGRFFQRRIFQRETLSESSQEDEIEDLLPMDDNEMDLIHVPIQQATPFFPLNFFQNVKVVCNDAQFNEIETISVESIGENKDCFVCIEPFEENDRIKKLKCSHIYHEECIKKWLCEESNKCPVCRVVVSEGIYKN